MAKKIKLGDPKIANKYFETKLTCVAGPMDLDRITESGESVNIVDAREESDFESGHIPGAISLPQEQWSKTKLFSKKKLNIIYSYSADCMLSSEAARYFSGKGYRTMVLAGGYEEWEACGYKPEKGKAPSEKPEKSAA